MKIKSIKKFIEKSQKGEFTTTDIYKFIESYTNFDLQKMFLLKNDIIEYKKRTVLDNLGDIQSSPKFITMELNKEKIPLYSNFIQIVEETDDENKHEEVFEAEMDEFIEEFMPGHFKGINRAQKVLQTKIEYLTKEMLKEDHLNKMESSSLSKIELTPDPKLEWLSSEIDFVELVKSLIEAKVIRAKSEKVIFKKLAEILNVPKFNKDENIRWIGDRKKNTTPFLNHLEEKLNQWAAK